MERETSILYRRVSFNHLHTKFSFICCNNIIFFTLLWSSNEVDPPGEISECGVMATDHLKALTNFPFFVITHLDHFMSLCSFHCNTRQGLLWWKFYSSGQLVPEPEIWRMFPSSLGHRRGVTCCHTLERTHTLTAKSTPSNEECTATQKHQIDAEFRYHATHQK